ncbi:MAG: insulinase family protein [Bacteroidetes bacterium]|nr:insulinase family protein [Bacteroidota bacterium]
MKFQKLLMMLMISSLGLSMLSCNSEQGKKGSSTTEFKIDYEKYTLDNGLDVILHKDDSDPIVSVAIMYHVGSNREKPGRTGFAHFFEHMLFQNSENVGKGNFFKKIEEVGGTLNGGTWTDGTVYYEVVPKDALERILWMESDRMGFMINTVTEPVLENEKQVVKNEKRQRVDNQPYGHTSYVIGKTLYQEEHPYNWQVIGSLEDLEAATVDDVKEFYDKWYGPNNATMVIAGDFDFEEAKQLVENYFGEFETRGDVTPIEPKSGTLTETVKLMHEDNFASLPELTLVWPTVEDGHPDYYALDFLGQLLSIGKRAPFYKEIVENQKLAPSTSSYNSTREISGEFRIRVRANKDVDLNSVHDAIFKAMADFEENGIDGRDMERIKNKLETDFYGGISSILGKSFQLAQYNEFRGTPDALAKEVSKILAVTKEDVMRVYEKHLKGKPYIATSFVPKGNAELALEDSQIVEVVEEAIVAGAESAPLAEDEIEFEKTPSKIDRSVEPALGEAPTLNIPKIWKADLKNDLKVFGIENSELPLVEFSLQLKGGMLLDNPEKIGVANLMTDIMMEGTKNKTPEELQDAIGQLGADISMFTASEYISINASCLSRNFDAVLALVEEILLEPRWDENEFDRLKQKTITTIQQREANPNSVAGRVFSKLIYGDDHILSNSTSGKIASVETITLDDLKQFYAQNYAPNVSSFHIVGAVSESKVKTALTSIEEKWAAKDVVIPNQPTPAAIEKPTLYFVDVPESKQSVIQVGCRAVPGNHEDYYAATVTNYPLGGSFTSQLNMTLREEKGYTYGARSFFNRRVNDGFFMASSSVRSNVTPESVSIFKDLLSDYKNSYSEEDLEKTKTVMIKKNARAFETLYQKMGILQNISTFDLPFDYIKQEEKIVLGMDMERSMELINKYINPDRMLYLVVGDAKTQVEPLKSIGLGDPVMLDKEGMPVEVMPN